ncbi:MAG: hypothetical protein ED557_10130 [Balneola sp.]|nr:MAG: hypothetical protein ED557_10130 [Balneola sp.]
MKRYLALFFIASPLLFFTPLHAQMFSVGEVNRTTPIPNSYLRIGLAPTEFEFMGDRTANPNSVGLESSSTAFVLHLDTPSLNLNLLLANSITGLDDKSLLDLSLSLSNQFTLIRRPRISAGIPLQLSSVLTNANNDQDQENFNQGSFAIGAGAFTSLRFARRAGFVAEFIPSYGFSNSSGGFFGGSVFMMNGKAKFDIHNVIRGRSLSFGYDFMYRSFDVDDDFLDFDLTSHQITLGISF